MDHLHSAPLGGQGHGIFAVKVRSRAEISVTGALRQKGFSVLLPTYIDHRQYSDRVKKSKRPLFPGYVFVHLRPQELLGLVSTNGVSYVVKRGNLLQPLPSEEEVALQSLCGLEDDCEPCDHFAVGQRVEIQSGPLKGQIGTLVRFGTKDRLVVSINSIFSSVSVDIKDTAVLPVSA